MYRSFFGWILLLAAVCGASHAIHASQPGRLAAPLVSGEAEPVTAWDTASPQRLVRIDGALYQEDGGFYYPAEEGRITVRLIDEIADWRALVHRAVAAAPASFSPLDSLVPLRSNKLGIVDLEIPAGTDPTEWCDLVFRTGLVRYAEIPTHGVYVATPNDPQYSVQWALSNTGQSGGTPGADIDAELAWDITSGSPAIVVGVLDSGTSIDHVDLAANVWHNPGETPDNGADDDSNGYVDDWEGWDFPNNSNNPRSSNFHGTHVTGIVNGATNNGTGIAGIAGGGFGEDGALAMALEVGEFSPQGSILDDAILYAADNGAHVIQMSLSVGETSAINDALDYAYNTKDVFIDCAAGNNGGSVSYPARNPNVMAIASTDRNDNRSSFSNPGPEVEVAAPGSSIQSTQLNNSYGSSSGTSFAAPQVAGVAALIRSVNPGVSAPEVRQILIDSAEDVESPGFDNLTGWGRINAFQALSLVATSDGTVRLNDDVYSCDDSLTVTVSDIDLVGTGSVTVLVKSDLEPGGESIVMPENGSTGIFSADIATSADAAALDGLIQVAHADTIVVDYVDADDGQGGNNVIKSVSASTDCLPPLIASVDVVGIDDDSATVTWSTDEPGTSVVRFGTTTPPTQEVSSAVLVESHSLFLSGLDECTIYKFEVESTDDLGNSIVDDDGGSFYSFETFGNFPGVGIGPCSRGQVSLDKSAYACEDSVLVSVTDADLGSDPGAVETIQVLVTTTSEPVGEWITLTELGPESTGFEGTISVSSAAPTAGDGSLSVALGDLVTATYLDEDDGDGNTRSATATSIADCAGPRINGVLVTALTSTRAEIQWSTDEPSISRVEYGPDASLGFVVEDLVPKTFHRLPVSAFEACDRVWFRLTGTDDRGNSAIFDAAGLPFVFDMKQIGGLLFHDNFEVDGGWILQGEWRQGAPEGLGSSNGDPDGAFSGAGVIGTDLTGLGAFPGDYEPISKDWAVSPVLNASGASNLELIVKRKLGVAAGDVARITVFAPSENEIWSSTGTVNDADWIEIRHGIAAEADGQGIVRVGFLIDSDGPGQSFGWNLDEVIVKDATQPDYLACGGCAGAPTFAGVTEIIDLSPCGPGGLTLLWEAAPAWGSGSGGTYDVHRGLTPDFVPGLANRVASGISGTNWTDATAPVDTPVWYVVRARNDESCAGGEGLVDENTVRLPGTETIDRPVPGSVGDSLEAFRVGVAHVRLSWDPVPDAAAYRVRRSESADFGGAITVANPEIELLEDQDAAADPTFFTYRVTAVNACGQEGP